VLATAAHPRRPELSPDALAHLAGSRSAQPDAALPPQQAQVLFEHTVHRHDRAAAVLRRSIEGSLHHQPLAALHAAERLVSQQDDRALLETIQRWRRSQPPAKLGGEVGALLQRLLPAEGSAAKARPGARPALDPAVQALLQGAAENGCWKRLEQDVLRYVKSSRAEVHPVSRLAANLRKVLPELPEGDLAALAERGWRAFSAAARACPALEVAALLRPAVGIGRIALSLAYLDTARAHVLQEAWWESLLGGLTAARWGRSLQNPGDREEAALNVIYHESTDLLAMLGQAPAVQELIGQRIERIYIERGVPLPSNLVPRAAPRAGAAR
jgi:hypothetical protein